MRSAREIHNFLLEQLDGAVRRPGMYGGTESGIELAMLYLLANLCYIDKRELEYEAAKEDMRQRDQFGCAGVLGVFKRWVGHEVDYIDEIASVYASVARRLGYFVVGSTLSPAAFRRLRTGLRTACRERDWRFDEVTEHFGVPSLTIGTVLAYVPSAVSEPWVYFDFDRRTERWPDRNYLLRNVRSPASQFKRELTFTPYARGRSTTGSTPYAEPRNALAQA